MSIRFRRSKKIAPGLRLNLGKRGPSLTVGGKLGRVTVGRSGTRVGASAPGIGLYASRKVGSSKRRPATRTSAASQPQVAQMGSVKSFLRSVPPKESGTSGLIAMLTGSPKRKALQSIARASGAPSPESDSAVIAAVEAATDSWTVQLEAGLYFLERDNPTTAFSYLSIAADRFPGNRLPYYLVASDAAIDSANYSYAVSVLEPFIIKSDPATDLGALVFTTLANANLKAGDVSRSLELLSRLPLRKKNLNDNLLYALCVRACANRAAGKKAQAKKDIDRVYSHRPDFPMLEEAARQALAE